jgi:hypothetical protein
LWLEEEKLVHHLVREQEDWLLWIEEEKGVFHQDYFPPVCIPTVPYMPWVKNIPIHQVYTSTTSTKFFNSLNMSAAHSLERNLSYAF